MNETERDQYLRRVVHDFRGPLNAISLGARALQHVEIGQGAERIVESIRTNTERLAKMVGQLIEPPPAPGSSDDGASVATEAPAASAIRVLLVEDNADDAQRLQRELAEAGTGEFAVTRVDRLESAFERLRAGNYDVVLLDLFLPDSQGLDTLRRMQQAEQRSAIVVLTGIADRTAALEAVRSGAQDYLIKGYADATTLARAMVYAVERKHALEERERLIAQLLEALATVKRLSGLLPICASCKRIRDERGSWQPVEEYVHAHSEADFSHGICEECAQKLYPGTL